jgi:ubiquitin-protein ligase
MMLLHVCGVAAIIHPQSSSSGVVCLSILENMMRQGILCVLAVKNGMGVAT